MTGSHIYMKTLRINELLLTPVWHGVNYDWDCELWLVLWDICHFSTFTFWLRSRPLVSRAPMVMRGGWPPGQVRWELITPCSDEIWGWSGCGGGQLEPWSLGPVAHNQGRMGNDWVDTPPSSQDQLSSGNHAGHLSVTMSPPLLPPESDFWLSRWIIR